MSSQQQSTTGPAGPSQPPGPDPGPTEPPPMTAFAWRNGLVRPTQGRLLAGVCGALARGTNTDPILWRVVLAVLTLFGGVGLLVYLLGWLLLPAEGDTASPVEALLGRGHSRTSAALTVIAGIVALLSVGAFFSEPFRPGVLGAVLLGGAILLLLRDQRGRSRNAAASPTPLTTEPPGSAPGGVPVSTTTPEAPLPGSVPPPAPPYASAPPYTPPSAPYSGPVAAPPPPFAPRGPFAPPPVPPTPPTYVAPPPPRPRPPKPPRSPLFGLTLSLILLVIGVLALVDLSGFDIPLPGYFAAVLAVMGLGLVLGAWVGRARGLIVLGILLSIALAAVANADRVPGPGVWHGGTNTFRPTSLSQVDSSYGQDVGNLKLDLTAVDFASATTPTDIDVRVDWGNVTIIVPPNVDVVIDAAVDVGNAEVFGENWNGLGLDSRTVTNNGDDGPGGQQLRIHATVSAGNLEVHR